MIKTIEYSKTNRESLERTIQKAMEQDGVTDQQVINIQTSISPNHSGYTDVVIFYRDEDKQYKKLPPIRPNLINSGGPH